MTRSLPWFVLTTVLSSSALSLMAPAAHAQTEPGAEVVVEVPVPPPPATYEPQPQVVVVPAQQPVAATPPAYVVTPPARPARRGGYAPTWALFVPGIAMFGATYIPSVLAAIELDLVYGTSGEVTGWLYVPAIGPFVLAGYAEGSPLAQGLFTLLGLAQTAGLTLTILGLAINSRAEADEPMVQVTPWVSPELAGLGLSGRF